MQLCWLSPKLLMPARGQGCADYRLPSLLSSLSGYLLTPEDTWEEGENPRGTLSNATECKDSGRPSGVVKAKEVPYPIHDFTHGLALDLEQKRWLRTRGQGLTRKRRIVELTKPRASSSSTTRAREGAPAVCSLRAAQSCALRTALTLASSWAPGPDTTARWAICAVRAARAAPLPSPAAWAPVPLGASAVPRKADSAVDTSDLAILSSPDIFQDCGGEGKVQDDEQKQQMYCGIWGVTAPLL